MLRQIDFVLLFPVVEEFSFLTLNSYFLVYLEPKRLPTTTCGEKKPKRAFTAILELVIT